MQRGSKHTGIWLLLLVCALLLIGGILLIVYTPREDGRIVQSEYWKTILGGIMAFFGGTIMLSAGVALVAANDAKKAPGPGLTDPLSALMNDLISEKCYNAIQKKVIAALIIMIVMAAFLLTSWFTPFSILLAVSMVAGAAGALMLLRKGKSSMWALSLAVGCITGLVVALFSPPDTERGYSFIINGFKVGEGDVGPTDFLGGLLISVLLCAALTLGVAYVIIILCSTLTRVNP